MEYITLAFRQRRELKLEKCLRLSKRSSVSIPLFFGSLVLVLLGFSIEGKGQIDSSKSSKSKVLLWTGATYTVSLIALNELWYNDYDRSSFHFFDDNDEWLQMDKAGHAYSAYTLSKLSDEVFKLSSLNREKRLLWASASSLIFLSTIEVFDGYSSNWGFSWGDMIANTSGVGIYYIHERLWEQQLVRLKYSYHNTSYRKQRPETLGENTLEGAFKDYNGQSYWLSLNLNGLSKSLNPEWLNLAIGYGGEQMVFARQSANSSIAYRQYYIGLDVDLERIRTSKKWLKQCLKIANCIKFPLPTIEFREGKTPVYHLFYF
jgi:uncharacterized protein YfiM (DUF2279 family)